MRSSRLAAFTVATLVLCAASQARADDAPAKPLAETLSSTAKADYDAGKLLFGDGDYAGALVKFRSSYDASKDARLLWNMAACQKSLRHYAKAIALVERYVDEGRAILTESDRREAQDLLQALAPFVTPLRVNVNEPGASVFVDDEPIATSPMTAPVRVDIGTRAVRVTKAGFFESTKSIVVSGDAMSIDVTLAVEVHQGHIVVNAGPNDAIQIDGMPVAVGHWESTAKSGGHFLRVTARGMQPYQTEIIVQDDQTRHIDVTLSPVARTGLPTWAWVTGGAVLVAGAALGGYFLLRPHDESTPPVAGTMGSVPLR